MFIRETTAAVLFVLTMMLGTCAIFSDDPVNVYSERSSSQHELDDALGDVREAVDELEKAVIDKRAAD